MFKKENKNKKAIELVKEEDEELYLELMKLYDELIEAAIQQKPRIVGGLKKSKEETRDQYVNNLYGSTTNPGNPYLNQTFLKITIPKLKKEKENLKIIVEEDKQKKEKIEEKEKSTEKLLKEKIHPRADDEFSLLLKWMQEIHDNYLLVFNRIDFEIFTKRKIAKLNETLYKYSNSHTNSLVKQYIYELDNIEKFNKQTKYNNFHIKYMETLVKDWFWLYDTTHWILKKELTGEKMFNNPDEPIAFSDEELELESNKEYVTLFHNKPQLEAFKIATDKAGEIYIGLDIEKKADTFNIELRPI